MLVEEIINAPDFNARLKGFPPSRVSLIDLVRTYPIVARVDFVYDNTRGVEESYGQLFEVGESVNGITDDFLHDRQVMEEEYRFRLRRDLPDAEPGTLRPELVQLFVNGTNLPRSHEWFKQLENHFGIQEVVRI